MVWVRALVVLFCLCLLACKTPDNTALMQENLNNEIRARLSTLNKIAQADEALQKLVADLHQQSENLILLSKRRENANTAVSSANIYYRLMAKAVTGQPTEPMILFASMSPVQIQLAIKQNELWLLNNLINLNKNQDLKLSSVVEKTLNWH